MGPAGGGGAMSEFRLGEFHAFSGSGRRYLYLVPSGAIFELGDAAAAVIERLKMGARTREQLVTELTANSTGEVEEAIDELHQAHAIMSGNGFDEPPQRAPMPF